jgi:hypothetical protein
VPSPQPSMITRITLRFILQIYNLYFWGKTSILKGITLLIAAS